MALSVDNTTVAMIEGELRASKGALIFIPDNSGDRHLRVDVPLALDGSFRRGRATMTLVQSATAIVEAKRFDVVVEPEHGVPEKIIGDVVGQDGDELEVAAGPLSLIIRSPEAGKQYTGRVVCQMQGGLQARDAALL